MTNPDNLDIYQSTCELPLPGVYAFRHLNLSIHGISSSTMFYELENAFMRFDLETITLHKIVITADGLDIHEAWKKRKTERMRRLEVKRDSWDAFVESGRMVQIIASEPMMRISFPVFPDGVNLNMHTFDDLIRVQPMTEPLGRVRFQNVQRQRQEVPPSIPMDLSFTIQKMREIDRVVAIYPKFAADAAMDFNTKKDTNT